MQRSGRGSGTDSILQYRLCLRHAMFSTEAFSDLFNGVRSCFLNKLLTFFLLPSPPSSKIHLKDPTKREKPNSSGAEIS